MVQRCKERKRNLQKHVLNGNACMVYWRHERSESLKLEDQVQKIYIIRAFTSHHICSSCLLLVLSGYWLKRGMGSTWKRGKILVHCKLRMVLRLSSLIPAWFRCYNLPNPHTGHVMLSSRWGLLMKPKQFETWSPGVQRLAPMFTNQNQTTAALSA